MEDRNEKIFDALLKVAAEEAFRREIEAMPSCEELNALYKPSPEFDKRMRKLIAKHTNKQKRKNIFRTAGKIAAGFAVFLVLTSTVLISVEASRNYILNAMMEWQDGHTAISFEAIDDDAKLDTYVLGYLPDGFTLQTNSLSENMRVSLYTDESGNQILFQQFIAEATGMSIDNEDKHYEVIKIGDIEAHFFRSLDKEDRHILIWTKDGFAFKLIAGIDVEELIKIAESVTKNK